MTTLTKKADSVATRTLKKNEMLYFALRNMKLRIGGSIAQGVTFAEYRRKAA